MMETLTVQLLSILILLPWLLKKNTFWKQSETYDMFCFVSRTRKMPEWEGTTFYFPSNDLSAWPISFMSRQWWRGVGSVALPSSKQKHSDKSAPLSVDGKKKTHKSFEELMMCFLFLLYSTYCLFHQKAPNLLNLKLLVQNVSNHPEVIAPSISVLFLFVFLSRCSAWSTSLNP